MLCDCCCSANVVFEIDHSRGSPWKGQVRCEDCGASVGTHKGTEEPLGRMATANTRRLRRVAHAAFDLLWKSQIFPDRDTAYIWLAGKLGIDADDCHISTLDDEALIKAASLSRDHFDGREHVGARRADKRRDKARKQRKIVRNHVVARKRR